MVNLKSFLLILLVFGVAFLSWASMGYGFGIDFAVWFAALLVAAGFSYLCERFTAEPSRLLLRLLWIATVTFAVLSIGAIVVGVLYREELVSSVPVGGVLSAVMAMLMAGIAVLGRAIVAPDLHPIAPHDETLVPQECPSCGHVEKPGAEVCSVCGSALSRG